MILNYCKYVGVPLNMHEYWVVHSTSPPHCKGQQSKSFAIKKYSVT